MRIDENNPYYHIGIIKAEVADFVNKKELSNAAANRLIELLDKLPDMITNFKE